DGGSRPGAPPSGWGAGGVRRPAQDAVPFGGGGGGLGRGSGRRRRGRLLRGGGPHLRGDHRAAHLVPHRTSVRAVDAHGRGRRAGDRPDPPRAAWRGQARDPPGRMSGAGSKGAHRRRVRMTTRGRRTVIALGILAAALAGVAASGALSPRGAVSIPSDPCASPPVLRTHRGVTLHPSALKAFSPAERLAGSGIIVV